MGCTTYDARRTNHELRAATYQPQPTTLLPRLLQDIAQELIHLLQRLRGLAIAFQPRPAINQVYRPCLAGNV